MKHVGSYEAKTHLPALLDSVEAGESIVITRRGRPAALLTRLPHEPAPDVRAIIQQLKSLRRGNRLGKGLSVRALIEEGRRY